MKEYSLILLLLLISMGHAADKVPSGISDAERTELLAGLDSLKAEVAKAEQAVAKHKELTELLPDVQVCMKALDWGLNYDKAMEPKMLVTAREVLEVGLERAAQLQQGQAPWLTQTGKVIRGFRSRLDDNVQPYVINVPASWRGPQDEVKGERRPYPLFLECPHAGLVTELAVINAGLHQGNGFADDESLHLRAYARGYNAAKFAGEVNIFEQLAHAQSQYPVDDSRIVLHGFSMGGSCAWHLAAHHPDRWVAASPGAGFADTEHFVKIWEWEKQPPPWHFTLFRLYNATDVAGNIAMVPTFSYVGEKDGHRFSHDAMAAACARDGVPLRRVLGQNTGHNYEKNARAEIETWMRPIVAAGRPQSHAEVRYATYSLRYDRCEWVHLDRLDEHWKRADIHAHIESPDFIRINTANVSAFTIDSTGSDLSLAQDKPVRLSIDGQYLDVPAAAKPWRVSVHKTFKSWPKENGKDRAPTEVWNLGTPESDGLRKVHGLTGPVDDAFMERFLFVRPTGKPMNEKFGAWVASELDHAQKMWRTIYRGNVLIKDDRDVTDADIAESNLILWGDPQSNALIARVLPQLPMTWTTDKLILATADCDAATHAPILIYPNPINPQRYIVLNSGPTQREAHLATSSLTTPKLPDFALINLDTPPDGEAPGAVIHAGFFDEAWKPKASKGAEK
ncbi:prolyl oligopeptidase family serine peptidase [soil metagenome]